ncbi:hypothetical protein L21SP4_01994 [Kiritimatiella glycovorans]|uniref:Uncharacterized protein n=1 Tax=Kiritimatiella glycovorans TaxID=1307763 RepID=A0A0G3EFU1_9BACT|nr:hypothetical protein L21SP4_01994 [Kiritimatiella glycovorans]
MTTLKKWLKKHKITCITFQRKKLRSYKTPFFMVFQDRWKHTPPKHLKKC